MLVHTHWPHVSDGPERKQTTTREAMRIYICTHWCRIGAHRPDCRSRPCHYTSDPSASRECPVRLCWDSGIRRCRTCSLRTGPGRRPSPSTTTSPSTAAASPSFSIRLLLERRKKMSPGTSWIYCSLDAISKLFSFEDARPRIAQASVFYEYSAPSHSGGRVGATTSSSTHSTCWSNW